MSSIYDLGYGSYSEYLSSSHWHSLQRRYLKHGRCYICRKTYTLLLHHERYDHAGKEKLGRDLVVLCYACHEAVHFIFGGLIKVPLKPLYLKKRRQFLRFAFLIQNDNYGPAVPVFLTWLFPV